MMPILLPPTDSTERSRLLVVDEIRRHALARLYERRQTVENLIQSLEVYQRMKDAEPEAPKVFSFTRKCS